MDSEEIERRKQEALLKKKQQAEEKRLAKEAEKKQKVRCENNDSREKNIAARC
jgi:hypothetical protein